MSHDFKQKEPSKTEKMLYEIVMAQNSMEKGLWSTSTLVITLAILTNQDPEKVAELMVNGDAQLKEYSKNVNDAIKKLEEAKGGADAHAGHDHAGHDYNHGDNGPKVEDLVNTDESKAE